MGFLSGMWEGKKQTYSADPTAGTINDLADKGLRKLITPGMINLRGVYGEDPTAIVDGQIGMENKLMTGAAEDARRQTQSLVAQRGMSDSSVGLGTEINQGRQLSDKLALNNASSLGRIRDMKIANGEGQMQTGSNLFGLKTAQGPIQMRSISQRVGGITGQGGLLDKAAPFAGAAAQAYAKGG